MCLCLCFDVTLQVFTWGRGKYGQLGHGSTQNIKLPVAVKALVDHDVIQIACGGDHTLAITSDGRLFSVSFALTFFVFTCFCVKYVLVCQIEIILHVTIVVSGDMVYGGKPAMVPKKMS